MNYSTFSKVTAFLIDEKMKNLMYIVFLYCILFLNVQAQDTINERYSFGYNYCIFSSVIATDSCFYVKALVANGAPSIEDEDAFIKFNLNGSPNFIKVYDEDTIGLNNWESNNLIMTLDNNFIQLIRTVSPSMESFMLIKQAPNGDTLFTTLLDTINKIESNIEPFGGLWPGDIIQLQDSSFLCSANVDNLNWQNSYIKSPPMLIKLDKNGNYLWHKIYWDFVNPFYNLSRTHSLIQYNDSIFTLIGGIGNSTNNDPAAAKGHPKWLFVDSLGNEINTLFINDLNNQTTSCFDGLKNSDGTFIYVGAITAYNAEEDIIVYTPHITKLDENFNQIWRIHIIDNGSSNFKVVTDLIPINDTEFVAMGFGIKNDYSNSCGYLVKFNINGELLWEREYVKIPVESYITTDHRFYDVDLTADSGFVMVGDAINSVANMPDHPQGQLGWLVKTDKHGCLVPGCEIYDNISSIPIDTTTFVINNSPTDSTSTDSTVITPPNLLYPNPATTELYYYHTQSSSASPTSSSTSPTSSSTSPTSSSTSSFNAYIFDLQGNVVQQFTAVGNNVTYIIDISQLSSATYIFKVVSNNGEIIISEKFVKVE